MNQTAVVDAIKQLRLALKLKGREVATAISGHSVIIKKIKVPPMTPEELEEQIPWEAEHHIPFSKDDVEIDHQARRLGLLLSEITKNTLGHRWGVPRQSGQKAGSVKMSNGTYGAKWAACVSRYSTGSRSAGAEERTKRPGQNSPGN